MTVTKGDISHFKPHTAPYFKEVNSGTYEASQIIPRIKNKENKCIIICLLTLLELFSRSHCDTYEVVMPKIGCVFLY